VRPGFFGDQSPYVFALAAPGWPGLDHQVIVTAWVDGTARVWDPRPSHSQLAHLALRAEGHAIAVLDRTTLAVATSRGFLVFELIADKSLHGP